MMPGLARRLKGQEEWVTIALMVALFILLVLVLVLATKPKFTVS